MLKNLSLLSAFLLVINASFIFPQLKFSGYGAAGYKFIDRVRIIDSNQETYFEGKLQAEIEVNKNIEAQLDFRGNSQDQRVEFREYSAKFSYLKRMDFKIGNIKKPFGYERIESRDDLYTIERSFVSESVSKLGYGDRSVGILGYYNYSKKDKDFPHSYYFFLYKNNNLQNGLVGRYSYHFDDFIAAANYFFLNTGGDYKISSQAFAAQIRMDKKDFEIDLELMLVQDPVEGQRRQLLKLDEKVFSYGARFLTVVGFDTDGYVIKEIEPIILLSYFQPDSKLSGQHTIQTLLGANFYFDKDVRLRFNADVLFTKNEFGDKYSTHDSRVTLEVQVRF